MLGSGSEEARVATSGEYDNDIERLHRPSTPRSFTRCCSPGGKCARFQLYRKRNWQRSFQGKMPRLFFGRQRPLGIRVSFFFRTALISGVMRQGVPRDSWSCHFRSTALGGARGASTTDCSPRNPSSGHPSRPLQRSPTCWQLVELPRSS
jgi:hypothetical protein